MYNKNIHHITREEFNLLVREPELETRLTVSEILSRMEFYLQNKNQKTHENEKK